MGLIAHIDAGKTTTTERILYCTGKNYKIGEVHDGAATMDWMPQEQERGITITAAASSCLWNRNGKSYQINIIDTPGHVDFGIEVERSLRVLDGAVVVFCGVSGVQTQTETVWKQANKFKIPRIAFVNKVDRKGSDFFSVVDQIKRVLNSQPVCINIPAGEADDFEGVIDLIQEKFVKFDEESLGKRHEVVDYDQEYKELVQERKEELVNNLADIDDYVVEKTVQDEKITQEELIQIIREGTLQRKIVPVFCGAALRNKGIQLLMNGIIDFLPSPLDVDYSTVIARQDIPVPEPVADFPLVALVFKVQKDDYAGFLNYLRVYQGTIKVGKRYYNPRTQKLEKVTKILRMHSNKREETLKAKCGEIVAVTGLKNVNTGDTLSEKFNSVLLEDIRYSEPVISIALEPKSSADSKKLEEALNIMVREDPSLQVSKNKEVGQLLISGMGELHLEIVLDKLKRDFSLNVRSSVPQVSYRESINKVVKIDYLFDKPIEDKIVEVRCVFELAPLYEGEGVVFKSVADISDIQGKNILKEVQQGVNESLQSGVVRGCPVTDIQVCLVSIDWKCSATSSVNLQAFKVSAFLAVRKCLLMADPILLSPVMKVEVTSPKEFMGAIISDFNSKKGKIITLLENEDNQVLAGHVALSNMFGYMTQLRSLSQGRGSYLMQFDHYQKQIDDSSTVINN